MRTIAVVLGASLALACAEAPPSEPPCTRWEDATGVRLDFVDEVDLLLVSDDSSSAADWALLMDELPGMLRALSTGDHDGDGAREHAPARSIHVGAISTDLGTAGFAVPTCEGVGDDGVLVTSGRTSVPECVAAYPTFHVLETDGDADAIAGDVACRAGLAWDGCGWEQPLEAALRALSPDAPTEWTISGYVPPVFEGGRTGHALGANAAFVRRDSVLAIVVVEDEDDCSVADPAIFDFEDATLGEPELRCAEHADMLHSIERYVRGEDGAAGLLGLRVSPGRLVLAVIGGVPPELISDDGDTRFEAILAHPAMEVRRDPALPTRLFPSCNMPGMGIAFPPRRLVETAHAIAQAGGSASVHSLCTESYAAAARDIVRQIGDRIGGPCLPGGITVESPVWSECTVGELLPPGERCDSRSGVDAQRELVVDGRRREECLLRRLTRDEALAGEAGSYVESAEDPLPGSWIATRCGPTGRALRRLGGEPLLGGDHRLYCPRSIGPDGGTCP